MRVANAEIGLCMEATEEEIIVLSVEKKELFCRLINELIRQAKGEMGNFVFSIDEKILNLSKQIEVIINPFQVDCNEKRIQQKLLLEMCTKAQEEYVVETQEMKSQLLSYIEKIVMNLPYDIVTNEEMDIAGVFKAYGVSMETYCTTLLEQIVNYMKILRRMCNCNVFIFVNLKTYLGLNELRELYKFIQYEKLNLILLESKVDENLDAEKLYIIDEDLCII